MHRSVLRAAVLAALTLSASAQTTVVEEGRLQAPLAGAWTNGGSAVAFSAGRLASGAPSTSAPGRAFTYTTNAGLWQLDASADALDGASNDRFGKSIALDADTLLVGAPGSGDLFGNGPGAAYLFTRTGGTWTQVQKFTPAVPKSQGLFGAAVALDGTTLAIGAPQIDVSTMGQVVVYVKSGASWVHQQTLIPSGLNPGARAGTSVALEGNRLVVGAPNQIVNSIAQVGRAFVFERTGSTWSQVAVIESPTPSATGTFGAAVALDGGRIAVAATREPYPNAFHRRVHLFTGGGASWSLEQTLTGTNTATQNCRFGASLALEGSRLLVGAPGHNNPNVLFAGTVKLFETSGSSWVETLDIQGSGAVFNALLGESVALAGDLVLGGAPGLGANAGGNSAYVWRLNPANPATYCTAKVASPGCLAAIGWSGTPSASSAAPFLVTATQVVSQKFGILIHGPLYNQAPFFSGVLCIGSPITRTSVQNSGGSASGSDCSGSFAFDFNAYVQGGGAGGLGAGDWVWAQYWFRDPLGSQGVGLSNGLRFRIQP